jgi:coenzyme F420 hydrogenase subunit beta
MEYNDYRELKKGVWDKERCSGCGACIAVCPADSLSFPRGGISPSHTEYCKEASDGVPCGLCVAVCPRVEPGKTPSLLGEYREIFSARAGFEVPGRQSGGAVTAILLDALEKGYVDAIVTVTEDHWTHRPSSAIITTQETLIHQAGSRYNWWVPLLSALKEAVITRKYHHIAVVGVPCAIEALRRIRESDHSLLQPFRKSIRLVIGLFCTESFDYQMLVEEKLWKEHGIEPWQIQRFDVKGKLEVTLQDGRNLLLPLKELTTCIRPGCAFCTDFTAIGADISAGAVGSEQGYTTLIVRTSAGQGFVEGAFQSGRLIRGPEVDLEQVRRLAQRKQERVRESS